MLQSWVKPMREGISHDVRTSGKWFALSALVGIVAGCGAIAFQWASQSVIYVALVRTAGYSPLEPSGEHALYPAAAGEVSALGLLAVLSVGGLISGWLVYTFAPEAEGHGTDAVIKSFHRQRGEMRPTIPLVKMLASAATIGTGGSGGREGPIAQIGAGFGSLLGRWLKLPARDRRILMVAGMGAGIGAIFRAPLASAVFAGEILYREADIESDAIVPAAISSIVGYSVFSAAQPAAYRFVPLFGDKLRYSIQSPAELVPLALMAVFLAAAGALYIQTFYGTHRFFARLPLPRLLRPALGATLAGVCGLAFYYAMGQDRRALAVLATGYGTLQGALERTRELGLPLLFGVAFVKIATTSLTIGSGGSGGVFGPSMVIGGCLGGAIGHLFHELWPGLVRTPEAYAIVGMAGFFAGCAHAPISTIIMVSELTGDYNLLVPTMWVSMLCFLMGRRWTLYVEQVPTRLDSPAHRGDFLVDVLEGIRVRDVSWQERTTVLESLPLRDILQMLAATSQNYFPVQDAAGRLVGIFSTDDVRRYLFDDAVWNLVVARDIMAENLLTVTPEDDLNTALRRFTDLNLDELPVVDAADSSRLLGMLRRKDAIAIYNRRMTEHKQQQLEHA